ncbi:hypothetical protein [Methylocystis sp.]|uniref:hypothetical protein n=1 Tax=Methylocystis sp. TaxID=1911079 RepID=UPI003DA5ED1B
MERLAHVSGIGSDAGSSSLYIRKRGEGELAVRAAFADAILIRPAVMFGTDDSFLTAILKLLRQLPIYPMFGRGLTRLQPAYVEDVAEAIAGALDRKDAHAITFEFGGPRGYSYEELLRVIAHEASLKPMFVPVPFAVWRTLAWFAEMLPSPPITRNQVELMQVDTVWSPEMPGFEDLGISPHSVEEILREMLRDHRSKRSFGRSARESGHHFRLYAFASHVATLEDLRRRGAPLSTRSCAMMFKRAAEVVPTPASSPRLWRGIDVCHYSKAGNIPIVMHFSNTSSQIKNIRRNRSRLASLLIDRFQRENLSDLLLAHKRREGRHDSETIASSTDALRFSPRGVQPDDRRFGRRAGSRRGADARQRSCSRTNPVRPVAGGKGRRPT